MSDTATQNEMMSDYLDGALSGVDLLAFERRLNDDAMFRREFELYQRTVQAVQGLPRQPMSEFGRARLRRALNRQRPARQPLQQWIRPLSYAAAAVLLLSIGFVSGQQLQGEQPGVVQALPNPEPTVRLRDAQTGGWMNVEDFARQVKRTRQNYAIVPQLRVPLADAGDQLATSRERVQAALVGQQVDQQAVQFFAPVELNESVLNGPEIEFWVQPVGLGR